MTIEIYTDGACKGNPGPGGWGLVVVEDDAEIYATYGGSNGERTTNNVMEITAVIEAFKYLETNKVRAATIISDSKYCIQGLTEWCVNWEKREWRTSTGKPVLNVGLWKELLGLHRDNLDIKLQWIKGHSGHKWNDRADGLSNVEAGL